MKNLQREFIEFAIQQDVIRFGSFALKAGRVSPYMFDTGLFDSGESLRRLGEFYAAALIDSGIQFDAVFGPAYKGIPLVSTLAISLSKDYGRDVPYSFDRKELKNHGEGGIVVGAPLAGRVVIVDDVVSSGISVRGAADLIQSEGATPAAVLIALDRQEVSSDESQSAIAEISEDLGIPVIHMVRLDDLVEYLEAKGREDSLREIEAYRKQWGT
jgi:orotate phosphoribosyltransferase